MDDHDPEWQRKGATLSDKTARKEFGLTQEEIVRAIRAGKLQYREGSTSRRSGRSQGFPYIEALVKKERGADHLKERQAKTELTRINGELKRLKREIAAMEERKSKLLADLAK